MDNQAKKYFNVLRQNEDLSYGGVRTLKMIEDEFDRLCALAKQSELQNNCNLLQVINNEEVICRYCSKPLPIIDAHVDCLIAEKERLIKK